MNIGVTNPTKCGACSKQFAAECRRLVYAHKGTNIYGKTTSFIGHFYKQKYFNIILMLVIS